MEKSYFDKRTKPIEPLDLGGSTHVQNMQNKTWQPAVVIDKYNDRSYSVRTENCVTYRRNRRHLIKTNECMTVTSYVEMHIPEENNYMEGSGSATIK